MNQDSNRRILRVQKAIRDVLSLYLISRYQDELSTLISVPDVRVSKDLKHAKVLVSSLNHKGNEEKLAEELNERSSEIQAHLNKQLQMKFCPRVRFYPDKSFAIWDKFKELSDDNE